MYPRLFLLVYIILLSACSPSANSIETAIAQTQAANPTETSTSTSTPTLTSTTRPTPTASSTPDLRVIDVNPNELLLQKSDLPSDAQYYIPPPDWTGSFAWGGPQRNDEWPKVMGVVAGQNFLERTGRVDGMWVNFLRGTSLVIAPEGIFDNVMLFETHKGAMVYFNYEDNYGDIVHEPNCTNSTMVKTDLSIGDASDSCKWHIQAYGGGEWSYYMVVFVYHNIVHRVGGADPVREIRFSYIEDIARTLLEKLQAAPLSDKVTYKP